MELDATRLSLGCVGYELRMNDYPDPLFAIRPDFVREIDVDPYGKDLDDAYLYFVPVRDQERDAREAPTPHEMRVSTEGHVGDQRQQISNSVRVPDLDAYMSRFSTDDLKKISQDLANLVISNAGAGGPLVISKASGLYLFLASPCETVARQTGVSDEVKEELLTSTRRAIQESDELRQLADRARSSRELPKIAFISLLSAYTRNFATQLREHQNEAREQSFIEISLGRDSFVLYSAGVNGQNDLAREVGIYGTDYLLWPPMMSLVREHRDMLELE
ncbi:MAG: hypothetical protein ACYTF7_12225 [Planctomycetota bacterium]|jgi:hypothetical protein